MRQKLWTLYTVSLVMGIARTRHMDVDMIAQSDNMQIIIRVPNSNLHRKFYYAEDFLKEISKKSDTIVIPINLSESWISTKSIEYSRINFYSGYECPSDLKKVSRLDSATPHPVDEFREHFYCFQASGLSTASASDESLIAFVVVLYNLVRYLGKILPAFASMTNDEAIALLMIGEVWVDSLLLIFTITV